MAQFALGSLRLAQGADYFPPINGPNHTVKAECLKLPRPPLMTQPRLYYGLLQSTETNALIATYFISYVKTTMILVILVLQRIPLPCFSILVVLLTQCSSLLRTSFHLATLQSFFTL